MRTLQSATRRFVVLAVPLLLAGVAAAAPPASAQARPAAPAAGFVTGGQLFGVTTTSARNAWAVGSTSSGKTLIIRWNGNSWKRVASPSPSSALYGNELQGVTATSARNAWAVGYTSTLTSTSTLILRWNGSSWKRVPSPTPAGGGSLSGVAAVSPGDVWAVGGNLILHWNGTAWKRVRGPSPAGSSVAGVAATSPRHAWAVGVTGRASHPTTLVDRWNGATWRRVASPSPNNLNGDTLHGVAVTPAGSAWAVGCSFSCVTGGLGDGLILRWTGTSWTHAHSPLASYFAGVCATSAGNAWAVGTLGTLPVSHIVIAHWNGKSWKKVPSPSPVQSSLADVAATSARNAWAVGFDGSTHPRTLILRWNGRAWK